MYIPGDTTAHQDEYYVAVDSALPNRGCFADSLAIAVGARVGYVFYYLPAFSLSHLSQRGLDQVRRTPHVIEVTKSSKGRLAQ